MSRLRHVSRLMIACSLMTVAGCQPKEKAEQQSTHPNVTISQERPLTIQGNASGVVSYAPAVKAAAPAVVNIFTTETIKHNNHPLMNPSSLRDDYYV